MLTFAKAIDCSEAALLSDVSYSMLHFVVKTRVLYFVSVIICFKSNYANDRSLEGKNSLQTQINVTGSTLIIMNNLYGAETFET